MAANFGHRTRGTESSQPTLRYPYRPRTWVMVLSGMFFAVCAVVLGGIARSNDRGVIIDRLITLDTGAATVFYWAVCAISVAFVAVAISGVIRSLRAPREVAVGAGGVTVPARRSAGDPLTIPFDSITDLRVQQVRSQRFLVIHHRSGRNIVAASMMPSAADFDAFVEAVTTRSAARR